MKYRKSSLLILTLVVMCQLVVSVSSKSALALTAKGNEVKKNKTEESETKKENQREGELLIKFKPETLSEGKNSFYKKYELVHKKNFKSLNLDRVSVKKEEHIDKLIEEIKNEPYVAYVEKELSATISSLAVLEEDNSYFYWDYYYRDPPWASEYYGPYSNPGANVPNYQLKYPAQTPVNGPNDPFFSDQWNLNNTGFNYSRSYSLPRGVSITQGAGNDIDFLNVWQVPGVANDVVVAVIDTGVDYTHEDLSTNIWTNELEIPGNGIDDDANGYVDDVHGIDTANGDADPFDGNGHGTFVSGIIGAGVNNGVGIAGIAPNVKILPCKAFDDWGYGNVLEIAECLNYVKALKDRGVHIVATNNSYNFLDLYSINNQTLWNAIVAQKESGILFITSAGQKTLGGPVDNGRVAGGDGTGLHVGGYRSRFIQSFPAAYEISNIISVTATYAFDDRLWNAHYGKRSIHIGAPGIGIVSTIPGGYTESYGSSFATPHITGIAALVKSHNPEVTWKELKNRILAGADESEILKNSTISGKRANAFKALNCTNSPVLTALNYPFARLLYGYPAWYAPFDYLNVIQPGGIYTFSALSINCGNSVGPVKVDIIGDSGNIIRSIEMVDNGVYPDDEAGDGVFYAQWTPVDLLAKSFTISSPAGVESNLGLPVQADWKLIDFAELRPSDGGSYNYIDVPSTIETGQVLSLAAFARNLGEQGLVGTLSMGISSDELFNNENITFIPLIHGGGVQNWGPGSLGNYSSFSTTIPPDITSGQYYWSPVLGTEKWEDIWTRGCDGGCGAFNPGDANPNDNILVTPVTINHVESDLIFTNFIPPANVLSGEKTSVTFTFKNAGPTGKIWQSFSVIPYLSTDQTITTSDTEIRSFGPPWGTGPWSYHPYLGQPGYIHPINPIDVNEEVTGTAAVEIPHDLQTGTYYIALTIGGSTESSSGSGNIVNEVNKANNISAVIPITITEAHPDLIVTTATTAKSAWATGVRESVSVTTKNLGPVDARPYSIGAYLSPDPFITTSDIRIGGGEGNNKTGAEQVGNINVIVPNTVLSGTYYIGVIADDSNLIIESDLSNNIAAGEGNNSFVGPQITLTQMLPDLKFTSVSGTANGNNVSADFTVTNQGAIDAVAFGVNLYLSSDPVITTADTFIGVANVVSGLIAGSSTSLSISGTLPVTFPTGTYYIGAIVDSSETVQEQSEANNTFTGNQIILTRDIAFATISGSMTGEVINATFTIKNQGSLDTDLFSVGFYLSTDEVITTSDTLISETQVTTGLSQNGEVVLNFSYNVPINLNSGVYYIGAVADNAAVVEESDETNNSAGTQVTINRDLAVASMSHYVAGDQLTVTGSIINMGTNIASGSNLGVYISQDPVITKDDILVSIGSISSLVAGGNVIVNLTGIMNAPAGSYYVGMIVDKDFQISEFNEANNTFTGNQIALTGLICRPGLWDMGDGTLTQILPTGIKYMWLKDAGLGGRSSRHSSWADNLIFAGYTDWRLPSEFEFRDLYFTTLDSKNDQLKLESIKNLLPDYYWTSHYSSDWRVVFSFADGGYSPEDAPTDHNLWAVRTAGSCTPVIDIIITGLSGSLTGDQIDATVTVKNLSVVDAGIFRVGLYLSSDPVITETDTLISETQMNTGLANNTEAVLNLSVSVPVSLSSGIYYIGAFADNTKVIPESVETNNGLAGGQITINRDLVLTSISHSITANQLSVSGSITNMGANVAGASNLGIYLSLDNIITTGDILVTTGSISSIDAGGIVTFNVTGSMIASAGSYYVGVILDKNTEVGESDELNNIYVGNQIALPGYCAPGLFDMGDGTLTQVLPTGKKYMWLKNAGLGGKQVAYKASAWVGNLVYAGYSDWRFPSESEFRDLYFTTLGGGTNQENLALISNLVLDYYWTSYYSSDWRVAFNFADGGRGVEDSPNNTNYSVWAARSAGSCSPSVDIAVTSVSGVITGDQIDATVTVKNQSAVNAGIFPVGLYLSSDPVIATTDILISETQMNTGLASNAEAVLNLSVPVSVNLNSGTYYIGAFADNTKVIPEIVETNNGLAGTQVTINRDLAVASMSHSITGSQLTVTGSITNLGSNVAGVSTLGIYLSSDTVITTGDILVTTASVSSIGAGGTVAFNVTGPIIASAGNYYIGVILDKNLQVGESNEVNNKYLGSQIALSGSCAPGLFDMGDGTLTQVLPTGIKYMWLKDAGQGGLKLSHLARSWAYDLVYAHTDWKLPSTAEFNNLYNITLVNGTDLAKLALINNLIQGYYWTIDYDSDDYTTRAFSFIDGSSYPEWDNKYYGTWAMRSAGSCTPSVDIAITSVSGGITGDQIDATVTVKNQSAVDAGIFRVGLYLSADPVITETDTLISETQMTTGLSQNGEAVLNLSVPVPVNLNSGSYYIGAFADNTKVLPEAVETNNGLAGTQVTINRDLAVASMSHSITGSQLTVTGGITNLGSNVAGVSTLGIYLSSDTVITTGDILVTTASVSSIGAGGTVAFNVTGPIIASAGNYYIGVILDKNLQVGESNEVNNKYLGSQIALSGSCIPGLFDMGDGTLTQVLPTGIKYMWLKDAGQGGLKQAYLATSWANDLVYAHTDWKLPSTAEFTNLYSITLVNGTDQAKLALINNLIQGYYYTRDYDSDDGSTRAFSFIDGSSYPAGGEFYGAWAMRSAGSCTP